MGNYRQHITFASVLGVGSALAAYLLAGVHWMYGSVAALLATLGGLLPDLDCASGVELRGFTGILGVLAAVAVWQQLAGVEPAPAFEFHLWAVVLAYVVVRHGLRRVFSRISVHRGISHSVPTCAVWAELAFLYYPSPVFEVRLVMAGAVAIGFLSHLLLDEVCSVDLRGARVNRAFGSALKFRAKSAGTTFAMYALLSYLSYRVILEWPPGPFRFVAPAAPRFPAQVPRRTDPPEPFPRHARPEDSTPRRSAQPGRAGA